MLAFVDLKKCKLPCDKLKLVCCKQSHHLIYSEHFLFAQKMRCANICHDLTSNSLKCLKH